MANSVLNDRLLDRRQAAEAIGMSVDFITDMCKLKKLTYVQLGRVTRIKESDLKKFLEEQTVKAR